MGLLTLALVLKGLVWAITFPPFDTPDEPTHFAYAQLIALEGRLPVHALTLDEAANVSVLQGATLIGVTPGTPRVRLFPERAGSGQIGPDEYQANHANANVSARNPSGAYGPFTYLLFALPIKVSSGAGIVSQVMGARIVSIILGVIAVLATVFIARDLGLENGPALVCGVIVGFQPMWSQQTASVNVDSGVLAFCTVFLAVLVQWIKRPSPRLAATAAGVLLLALLSKPSALFAMPFLALFALPAYRAGLATRDRVWAWAVAGGCGVLALAPAAAWTVTHPQSFGGPSVHAPYHLYFDRMMNVDFFRILSDGLWGNFGWLEQQLPHWALDWLWWVTLATAMLVLFAVVRPRGSRRSLMILLLAYFLSCAFVVFAFDIVVWRTQGTTALQSRYFLPAIPAVVVAAMVGLQSLIGPRRLASLAPAVAALSVSVNLIALETLWNRFYVA